MQSERILHGQKVSSKLLDSQKKSYEVLPIKEELASPTASQLIRRAARQDAYSPPDRKVPDSWYNFQHNYGITEEDSDSSIEISVTSPHLQPVRDDSKRFFRKNGDFMNEMSLGKHPESTSKVSDWTGMLRYSLQKDDKKPKPK